MVWDASKSPGDLITSSDWNDMVGDQKGHRGRHMAGGTDEIELSGLGTADGTGIRFGNDNDFEARFDGNNNRFELYDNVNNVDVFRVAPSSAFTLVNRNLDLSTNSIVDVDLVDGVDVSSHASRHSDGGGDELDAADLAGSSGTSGQLLQTDGSAASWVDFQSGSDVSDDDSLVVSAPTNINFGGGLDASDDGDGSVTIAQAVLQGGDKISVKDNEPMDRKTGDIWVATGGELL